MVSVHTQNAVVLEVHEDNMACSGQRTLFQYWKDLKDDGGLPCWKSFDPARVPKSLPDIMLYDAQDDGDFFVSIIGQDCGEEIDVPLRPRPLKEFMPPENYQDVKLRLEYVRDKEIPHLVRKTRSWQSNPDKNDLRDSKYTVLFLPFRFNRHGLTHKILNVLHFEH